MGLPRRITARSARSARGGEPVAAGQPVVGSESGDEGLVTGPGVGDHADAALVRETDDVRGKRARPAGDREAWRK